MNEKISKLAPYVGVLLFGGGLLLYILTLRERGGAYLAYEPRSTLMTVAALLFIGLFAFFILRRPLQKDQEPPLQDASEDELYLQDEGESADTASSVSTEDALFEYPELFRSEERAESPREEEAPKARRFDGLYRKIEDNAPLSREGYVMMADAESIVDDLYGIEAREDEGEDILSDLPDSLPEGYEVYGDESFEDEGQEAEEPLPDGVAEPWRMSFGMRLAARVFLVCVLFALTFFVSIGGGRSITGYTEEGICKESLWGKESFSYDSAVSFEVSPTFFADDLRVTVYFEGGKSCELIPSGGVMNESFYEKYSSQYSYAAAVVQRLLEGGAERRILERGVLESGLFEREDIGEYVRKIVEGN